MILATTSGGGILIIPMDCAVLLCTDDPTQFSEIQFFNWEWRPEAKPYIDSFSGSRSKHPPAESEK